MGSFGDVRAVLQQPANKTTWEALIGVLERWYGREPLEVVLDYCKGHVSGWPDTLPTFAPRSWFKRDPETIAADPITPFFVFATGERTDHWQAWARDLIASAKASRVPKFMELDALGAMRWRDGEALSEDEKKRLITLLRGASEDGHEDLERLRQLLDDEDCQRWSAALHKAWEDGGAPSAHRWALFQIASFGNQGQVVLDGDELARMTSSGRHVRVKQLMAIAVNMGTRDALDAIARFAVFGSLHMGTRDAAGDLIAAQAERAGMRFEDFVEQRLNIHDPLPWGPDAWASATTPPPADEDGAQAPSLAELLEHAMCVQRVFPGWLLNDHLDALSQQPALLWSADDSKAPVRFTPEGAVDAKGAAVAIEDGQFLRITHPATLTKAAMTAWTKALATLKAEGVTPPFAQLTRPVFTKQNAVASLTNTRMPVRPWALVFESPDWSHYAADDNVSMFSFRLRGALWHATVETNFTYSYHAGIYARDDAQLIEGLSIESVCEASRKKRWGTDKVAFSETQYALQRLAELSASSDEGNEYIGRW